MTCSSQLLHRRHILYCKASLTSGMKPLSWFWHISWTIPEFDLYPVKLNSPFNEPKQEACYVKRCATSNFHLANRNNTATFTSIESDCQKLLERCIPPCNHLNTASSKCQLVVGSNMNQITYGIQLSGPIFLLINCEGSSAKRKEQ